jgi:hypothetical protein
MTRLQFDNRDAFLERLRALIAEGTPAGTIRVRMPFEVPEVDEILAHPPDRIRFFSLLGAVGGFGGGLALTIYSVVVWPIVVDGKPIISVPPFLLIGYLMTILFGSLGAFAGFLLMARMPSPAGLAEEGEFSDQFIIVVGEEEQG